MRTDRRIEVLTQGEVVYRGPATASRRPGDLRGGRIRYNSGTCGGVDLGSRRGVCTLLLRLSFGGGNTSCRNRMWQLVTVTRQKGEATTLHNSVRLSRLVGF